MALTPRKKKGLGYLITGGLFVGIGGIFIGMETTPDFVSLIIQAVGMLAGLFGITVVFPDSDPPA